MRCCINPSQVCPPPSIQVTNVSRKNLLGACLVAASHAQVVVVTKAHKEVPKEASQASSSPMRTL